MIRNICTDRFFLMQPSEPATAADLPVAQDLRDTLAAHRQACVGMAANMIGVRRRIIIFDDNGTPTVMLNPRHPPPDRAVHSGGGLPVADGQAHGQTLAQHQGPVAE